MARTLHVSEDVRIRFPGRDQSFCDGVEAGLLAAALAQGASALTVRMSPGCLEQAGKISERMGYTLRGHREEGDTLLVSFLHHDYLPAPSRIDRAQKLGLRLVS